MAWLILNMSAAPSKPLCRPNMLMAILTGWIALIIAIEWRFPQVTAPHDQWARRARNIALGLTSLIAAPIGLWIFERVTGAVSPVINAPLLLQLLALDLWTYATHRAYHRVPLLWRFHAPHHLDEHLDVTSAFRFHLGEILISGVMRLVPALLLGIQIETLFLFEAILLASAAFHHSNIGLQPQFERVLSWMIVTPSIHWVHHHNIRSDTDSNYAAILSVWDPIFASQSSTKRWLTMPIGTEGARETGFIQLLIRPFVSLR